MEIVSGATGKGTITTPGTIYALLRVYGNSPALITSYKINCGEQEKTMLSADPSSEKHKQARAALDALSARKTKRTPKDRHIS